MSDPIERVLANERLLLTPQARHDRATLERLLDPEFREIGQSGRLWSRANMIEALLTSDPAEPGELELSEESVTGVGAELYLLTYRLVTATGASRRSSLWRLVGDTCQVVFHQGTPSPDGPRQSQH